MPPEANVLVDSKVVLVAFKKHFNGVLTKKQKFILNKVAQFKELLSSQEVNINEIRSWKQWKLTPKSFVVSDKII